MTKVWYVYGLSEDALGHRLTDLPSDPAAGVTFSVTEGRGTVTLTADEAAFDQLDQEIALRLEGYVYSDTDPSLAACVVPLLTAHGLTVATAESCTGGLIAAALTDVPGASRVFGTGVVSYSNDCKEHLLAVSEDTLAADGAVSAATAGQMARGVRRTAQAAIGLSVTGEAGPIAAEDHPVGTVFIALADKKRTWVEQLHLEGDRPAIRRAAADHVLWLLWRYLSAYPAVMAGGESHRAVQRREIPRTKGSTQPRLLSRILPWRGDSRRRLCVKWAALLTALAVLAGSLWAGYRYLLVPDLNRQLQDSLGDLYYESTDLTQGVVDSAYPQGMLPVFHGLYDMNRDIGGWIHIPDTGVDYPVMQYADGYYRNHNFGKEYSLYGQPYLDDLFSLTNEKMRMVHGRNTGDGQMFSDLLNYRRVAYLEEHPVVEMNTLYGNARWQIFAVCVLDSRDSTHFNLQEEPENYDDFLDSLLRRSLYLSDLTVTGEDTFLLLTANAQKEYGFSSAQLVVAARLLTGEAEDTDYRVNNRALMPSVLVDTRTTTRPPRTTSRPYTTTTGSITDTTAEGGEDTTTTTINTTVTDIDIPVTDVGTASTDTTVGSTDTTPPQTTDSTTDGGAVSTSSTNEGSTSTNEGSTSVQGDSTTATDATDATTDGTMGVDATTGTTTLVEDTNQNTNGDNHDYIGN